MPCRGTVRGVNVIRLPTTPEADDVQAEQRIVLADPITHSAALKLHSESD